MIMKQFNKVKTKNGIKFYGYMINLLNDVSWRYEGKIKFNLAHQKYYFIPSGGFLRLREDLIFAINDEIKRLYKLKNGRRTKTKSKYNN